MCAAKVALIDYGMGNLLSVQRGLERVGAEVHVTSEPEHILSADRVVLPGVGAFPDAMDELERRGLVPVMRTLAKQGTPLLGICLGMQILFDVGLEFGETAGLGLIPGRVLPMPKVSAQGDLLKIPHIGWNSLHPAGDSDWQTGVLAELESGEAVYFVHSFMAQPQEARFSIAHCFYGGIPIAAVVGRNKVLGCQFHPEKSGEVGLRVLRGFLSL
ncbi:MAG: imidazole glycerol phosphate synthase subunit HisH [Pseudomonadota bacterium]